jgi:hypothetical protein
MIFSCLAALTLYASQVTTPIHPKIADYTINTCAISSDTKRSWIVTTWHFKDSGYHARVTLNHQFDHADCKVEKMFWYVDDRIPNIAMTRMERKMVERWRGDVNLSMWRFMIDQCKLAKKAGL